MRFSRQASRISRLVRWHKPGSDQRLGFFRVLVAHGPAVAVAGILHPVLVSEQVQETLVLRHLWGVNADVTIFAGHDAVGKQAQPHPVSGPETGHTPIYICGQVIAGQQRPYNLGFGYVYGLSPPRKVPGPAGPLCWRRPPRLRQGS